MAYLHCHSCDWEQDDFWSWKWTWRFWKSRAFGYNPVSLMIDDVREYIRPRHIEFDQYAADAMGFKSSNIFSWSMLLYQWKRHARRLFTQSWWTEASWYRVRDTAICPGCGDRNFDID